MPKYGSGDLLVKSSALAVTVVAPAAIFFAADAGADANNPDEAGPPEAPPCCLENADAPLEPPPAPEDAGEAGAVPVAEVDAAPHVLPAGVASEQGMQVKTILVARSISDTFPQIHDMVGVRSDSARWHPNGLALDVMIPNAGNSEGAGLGDEIVAFALKNADRFGLQDVIWRGVYHTPGGGDRSGYGHFDHVHITTTGGGYPADGQEYLS